MKFINDGSELWWDIRPSHAYPTVEMRICDVCTRIEDAVCIAALYASLIRLLMRWDREGTLPPTPLTEIIAENRWVAQRYGVLAFFGDATREDGRVDIDDLVGTRNGCSNKRLPLLHICDAPPAFCDALQSAVPIGRESRADEPVKGDAAFFLEDSGTIHEFKRIQVRRNSEPSTPTQDWHCAAVCYGLNRSVVFSNLLKNWLKDSYLVRVPRGSLPNTRAKCLLEVLIGGLSSLKLRRD